MFLYVARCVLPVASPPIAPGAVAVHGGRIAAVGRRKDVQKAVGAAAEVRDLGDVVLIPGLVNAHAHLELSWMGEAPGPSGDYMAWLRDFLARCGRHGRGRGRKQRRERRAVGPGGIR